ncbi:MAG TPA: hypothetical protein VG939_06110, partial [Caulobacteraceae bacterium]|nr:hypothetical protein [Caulobacteraceae bacterium]
MRTLAERLPTLSRDDLMTLRANARRLETETGPRAVQAAELLPLIEAELAARPTAGAPAKAPRARRKPAAR